MKKNETIAFFIPKNDEDYLRYLNKVEKELNVDLSLIKNKLKTKTMEE